MNPNDDARSTPDQHAIDRQTMVNLALGDPNALEFLYDAYASLVLTVILRIVRDRQIAEELMHDVYLRVWQRAETYRPERGNARGWLLGIAHNTGLNELRRQRHRPVRAVPTPGRSTGAEATDNPLERVPDPEPSPAEMVWIRERRARLVTAMNQLPPVQRAVIDLFAMGYSQSEIAIRLDEPLGTVKTRMRRGMLKLRELLPELEPGHD